jgi:hypothetical protein
MWMAEEGVFRPSTIVKVLNGRIGTQLHNIADKIPSGGIARIDVLNHERSPFDYRESALVWWARPLAETVGILGDMEGWNVQPFATLGEDGSETIVLSQRGTHYAKRVADTEFKREFWLDVERDFALVRYADYRRENMLHEITWALEKQEGIGWFPKSWRVLTFQVKDGKSILRQETHGKVTKMLVGEEALRTWQPLDEKLVIAAKEQGITDPFTIAFPEGTVVSDGVARKRYTIGPRGEKIYTPKPEEIAQLATSRTQNLIFVCGLLAIFVFALSFVTWRAFRRARAAA